MIVLSLDPSFLATGWAVIDYEKRKSKIVACSWVPTVSDKSLPKTADDMRRAHLIAEELNLIIRQYMPDIMCSEIPLGSQNARAARTLGIAEGVVASVSSLNNLPLRAINPLAIKLTVCGNKSAEKSEIIAAVEKRYKIIKKEAMRVTRTGSFTAKHEAICDAIAVAIAVMTLDGKFTLINNCKEF